MNKKSLIEVSELNSDVNVDFTMKLLMNGYLNIEFQKNEDYSEIFKFQAPM